MTSTASFQFSIEANCKLFDYKYFDILADPIKIQISLFNSLIIDQVILSYLVHAELYWCLYYTIRCVWVCGM